MNSDDKAIKINTDIGGIIKKSCENSLVVMLKTKKEITKGKRKNQYFLKNPSHKKFLEAYIEDRRSDGVSLKTLVTQARIIKRFLSQLNKSNPKQATKEDVKKFILNLSNTGKKPSSINMYKIVLKVFYKHLYGLKKGQYPKQVDWIEKTIEKKEEKEILTREEIRKLTKSVPLSRDQCLIALSYDGALRVGETTGIRIKDLLSDNYGFIVKVNGKTGPRRIRLVYSVPFIKKWLNDHPDKNNLEAPLFVCLMRMLGEPLMPSGAYKILQKASNKIQINKKIHPHILRHSKLTHLADEGFNEMELRIFAGWEKNSQMPSVYLHQNEDAVERKIREKNGMLNKSEEKEKIENKREILKHKVCPMCEEKNEPDSKFCYKCGQILDIKAIREIEKSKDAMSFLIQKNPQFKMQFMEDMKKKIKEDLLKELKN